MSLPTPKLIAPPTVVKATLKALPKGDPIPMHFNPASLVYTVENSSQQQRADPKRRQFAGSFTGKLTMDLQFDTTATGEDVRKSTSQVAAFMQPSAKANKKGKGNGTNGPAPPVLSFDWGAYHFQGFMESFKETLDFFSADGVPLRALVSIGLARQDNVFDPGGAGTKSVFPTPPDGGPGGGSVVKTPRNGNSSKLAAQGGDAGASRALAAANGLESLRFTGGAALQVGGGIQLNAAADFAASASVSAGAGISAGAGVSASAGAFGGASAGAFAGASAFAGAGGQVSIAPGGGALFGSQASAGVPATMGAFAGLEAGRTTVSTTANLDPLQMMPATAGSNVAVGPNASFGLGGVALAQAGFSTNVGAGFNLSSRVTFDGD